MMINGTELVAAWPVVDQSRAEIRGWYVVLDRGDEYVTVALPSLDHRGEWGTSAYYTTSLGAALSRAMDKAQEETRYASEA